MTCHQLQTQDVSGCSSDDGMVGIGVGCGDGMSGVGEVGATPVGDGNTGLRQNWESKSGSIVRAMSRLSAIHVLTSVT